MGGGGGRAVGWWWGSSAIDTVSVQWHHITPLYITLCTLRPKNDTRSRLLLKLKASRESFYPKIELIIHWPKSERKKTNLKPKLCKEEARSEQWCERKLQKHTFGKEISAIHMFKMCHYALIPLIYGETGCHYMSIKTETPQRHTCRTLTALRSEVHSPTVLSKPGKPV